MSNPTKRADVLCRPEERAKWLIFDPKTNTPLIMNSGSQFIWNLCDGSHSTAEIVESFRTEYRNRITDGLSDDQIASAVLEHLEILGALRLLQIDQDVRQQEASASHVTAAI